MEREWVHQLCWLPNFLLLIAWQPLDRFSSNLGHAVALVKISEYGVMTFQPIREVTGPKTCFSKGCACPDDNFKSASPIHMKFSK